MPTINCDSARDELYKCIKQTDAVKKDNKSVEDIMQLPVDQFPSQCADLRKAFEDCVTATVEAPKE